MSVVMEIILPLLQCLFTSVFCVESSVRNCTLPWPGLCGCDGDIGERPLWLLRPLPLLGAGGIQVWDNLAQIWRLVMHAPGHFCTVRATRCRHYRRWSRDWGGGDLQGLSQPSCPQAGLTLHRLFLKTPGISPPSSGDPPLCFSVLTKEDLQCWPSLTAAIKVRLLFP